MCSADKDAENHHRQPLLNTTFWACEQPAFISIVEEQEEKWEISTKGRDKLRAENHGVCERQLVRNNYKALGWLSHALNPGKSFPGRSPSSAPARLCCRGNKKLHPMQGSREKNLLSSANSSPGTHKPWSVSRFPSRTEQTTRISPWEDVQIEVLMSSSFTRIFSEHGEIRKICLFFFPLPLGKHHIA